MYILKHWIVDICKMMGWNLKMNKVSKFSLMLQGLNWSTPRAISPLFCEYCFKHLNPSNEKETIRNALCYFKPHTFSSHFKCSFVHQWLLNNRNLGMSWAICYPSRGVQPEPWGPHAAQDGYKCGPTWNHKCT